jgi:SAM-dependent methyltransferase
VSLSEAYSATGVAWRNGPERVYQRLADVLVAQSPVPLAGQLVADVGAGTGAASRSITRVGGRPIALDLATGMLTVDRDVRPPALVADARHLPLATASCAAVVAAFSYNHVPDPELALADAARVVAPGGAVLASAYAADDTHPVKEAVEHAAAEAGWAAEPWIVEMKSHAAPRLASLVGARAAAAAAGLDAEVHQIDVPFPKLDADDLVAWRLGMAQIAPFVATLPAAALERLRARALELLGPDPDPLIRRMIVICART